MTSPTVVGYLTVYPAGTSGPVVSNLNWVPGNTVANLVVVKREVGGRVSLVTPLDDAGDRRRGRVVFDFESGTGGRYIPSRPLDTRLATAGATRLGPGASLDLHRDGAGPVPQVGAQAAVLNVAVTEPTTSGNLHPTDEARPDASDLDFDARETVSSRVFAKLGSGV